MLLPRCCRRWWNGTYLPRKDDATEPELVLRNGKRYYSDTTFDFRRPRTDYDRLCAADPGGLFLRPVGSGNALVIGHGGEHFIGWWPAQRLLVVTGWAGWDPELRGPEPSPSAVRDNAQELPDLTRLDELRWSDELIWELPSPVFYLMASVLHGLEPDQKPRLKNRMWIRSRLNPGVYRVLSSQRGRAGRPCLYRLAPGPGRRKGREAKRRSAGK
jgi:hypothetical protein